MKRSFLVDIITFFFILLFLYTGIAKLSEIQTVKEQMLASPFIGSPFLANIVTWALPISEITLSISLLIPRWHLKALYITCALMTLFTIYVAIILLMDNQLSCSCGGIIEELTPKQHVVFNSACVMLSVVAIAIHHKQMPSRQFSWITSSSSIGLLLLVSWTIFTAFTRPAVAKTGMEGRLLPNFDLLLTDSVTKFNTSEIPTGKPFVVIGFAPYCTHCQAETNDIIAHIQQFKDVQIYYITYYPYRDMKAFYYYYHLKKYPNIKIGWEAKDVFFHYFHASSTPYTAVFDAQKRLKFVFASQADANKLAQAVPN